MNGNRLPVRDNPPRSGEHTKQIMLELGFSDSEIGKYLSSGIIGIE